MLSWVADPSCPSSSISVFWLVGLAGTGKTTIVKTFCQRVSDDDRFLLASFFASRNSEERRDLYSILHTFAYDLATTSDQIRPHVVSAVREPQEITQQPMHEQMERLLAKPITEAKISRRTIVFAIDGLDECQKSFEVEGGSLIKLLAQALEHQSVKLLVASRQEEGLVNMFQSLSHVSLRLHDIGSELVEADVRRILNAGFAIYGVSELVILDRSNGLLGRIWISWYISRAPCLYMRRLYSSSSERLASRPKNGLIRFWSMEQRPRLIPASRSRKSTLSTWTC
jgi:hypothetical protein